MACAKVQAVGVRGSSVASVTTAGITTTSGNLIDAQSTAYSGGSTDMVVSDSNGNTWTNAVAQHGDFGGVFAQAPSRSDYAKNITGGAGHTFTLSVSPSGYLSLNITEISGADTSAPLGLAEGTGLVATTTPTFTTSGSASAGDIAVACVANYNTGTTITEASGWTSGVSDFSLSYGQHAATKALGSGGTVTYNPTSTSCSYIIQITTYKAAGAGNPTFSMVGSGVLSPLMAAALASAGSCTVNPRAAAMLVAAGIAAYSPLAASVLSAAGTGVLGALAASLFGVTGTGAFSPIPVVPGFSFSITGAGAANFRSAAKAVMAGAGAFNPVKYTAAAPFTLSGGCTVSFVGSTFKWDLVPGATSVWSPKAEDGTGWTPKAQSSQLWTRIH